MKKGSDTVPRLDNLLKIVTKKFVEKIWTIIMEDHYISSQTDNI